MSSAGQRERVAIQSRDATPQPRQVDKSERFVAFAFAGADMVVETDVDGVVTYAAGAFRTKFGRSADWFVGRPVRELFAPVDHEALHAALALLVERGRLQPLMIRLSDAERTHLALAGIALPSQDAPLRLSLSLARPPAPLASLTQARTPHSMARATEARLRDGTPCDLKLLEIKGRGSTVISSSEVIGRALEAVAPEAVASEIAPGRFGLVGSAESGADLLSIAGLLEQVLRKQGIEVSVAGRQLNLSMEGLTQTQVARALRQALNLFARGGPSSLDEAGFAGGLAGYIRRAGTQAAALRQTIRSNHFKLVFQPIVALSDLSVHHFEALIRPGSDAGSAFQGPQDFIMLVETLGLADELDLEVARLACEAASTAEAVVAFNVSGQSVQSRGFRDRLVRLLSTSAASKAGLVIVEMTETAEIEDIEEAARTADALRSLGVPFCLDDFGAGAIDIRLLRELRPNIVKLDGSYIPGVIQGGRERALVAGMVEIGRGAGAEIVAERIETRAEAEALQALGVQYGQGWLFGRPVALPSRPGGPSAAPRPRRRGAQKEDWG